MARVPLTKDYAHDVKAMAAVADAGLIYVCNPNNPTGTLTPKADIEWLVANKPSGAVVMVDEAYTHIAGAPFNTDLVAADKDLIVLRTFSKIYGMAGLRAGAALARPDLIEKLAGFSAGMMPITGMVAAARRSATCVPTSSRFSPSTSSHSCLRSPTVSWSMSVSRAWTSSWRCAKKKSTSGGSGQAGPRTCA